MQKRLLGIAIIGALGLTGCGGDNTKEPVIEATLPSGVVAAKAVFAPGDGKIPVPNDLLFGLTCTPFDYDGPGPNTPAARTSDLTLCLKGATTANPAVPPDRFETYIDTGALNTNSAFAANHLFALDGWSSVAPFVFDLSTPDLSVDIDAQTVVGGESVRVFRVVTLRTPSSGVTPPTGPVVAVHSELTAGVDYRVDLVPATEYVEPTQFAVRITPIKPLVEQASYAVVLTNGIKDSRGHALMPDVQFGLVKSETPLVGSTAALEPVRQLTSQMLGVLAGHSTPVDRASVIVASQFTVQGVGDALETVAQVANNPGAPAPASGSFTIKAPISAVNAAFTSGALLWQGQLTVPYYLKAPTMTEPLAPLKDFWKANTASLPGSMLGLNLTYVNRVPAKTGDEAVPVLMAVPGGSCVKPTAGWPVVIFQHGITANRTSMIPMANSLASAPACMATVAIDQPLHGVPSGGATALFHAGYMPGGLRERTFGVDYVTQNGSGSITANAPDGVPDSSGLHFINLTSPLTSRDNLRQTVADLLTLSRATETMDYDGGGADFDANKVYFVGHSLGGITGANFLRYDMRFTSATTSVHRVKAAVLANPGGGLAKMVATSPAFGPTINGGLALAGRVVGTAGYEQFLWLLQTVIDQGDPIANATVVPSAVMPQTQIPTLMFQVANDLVVPNDSSNLNYAVTGTGLPATVAAVAPFAGTVPLANAMGLTGYNTDQTIANGVRGFVKFNTGCHSTLLLPTATCAPVATDPALLFRVFSEMHKQSVTFFMSNGAMLDVTDAAVIAAP